MKKRLLSRRGAAIEMAIGVMLLMIAVSIVLLTLATIKHDRKNDDIAQLESRIELYEIGEYVCAHRAGYDENVLTPIYIDGVDTGYSVITSGEGNNINLEIKKNGEDVTVLNIWLNNSNGNIISWK